MVINNQQQSPTTVLPHPSLAVSYCHIAATRTRTMRTTTCHVNTSYDASHIDKDEDNHVVRATADGAAVGSDAQAQ